MSFNQKNKSGIGTAAVAIVGSSIKCLFGVTIKADPDNSGTVAIGGSDVTYESANATDGYPLAAGQETFVPAAECDSDVANIYAIASAAGQRIAFRIL